MFYLWCYSGLFSHYLPLKGYFLLVFYLLLVIFSFSFSAVPCSTQDLSSRPGTEPVPLAVEAPSPNHQTTRGVSSFLFFPPRLYLYKHCLHQPERRSPATCPHFGDHLTASPTLKGREGSRTKRDRKTAWGATCWHGGRGRRKPCSLQKTSMAWSSAPGDTLGRAAEGLSGCWWNYGC